MPELFESILADLEFPESDKVEIEDIILFLTGAQLSEKFHDARKCICSSGHF